MAQIFNAKTRSRQDAKEAERWPFLSQHCVCGAYALLLWRIWHKPCDQGKSAYYSIVVSVIAISALGLIAAGYLLFLLMQLGGQ